MFTFKLILLHYVARLIKKIHFLKVSEILQKKTQYRYTYENRYYSVTVL